MVDDILKDAPLCFTSGIAQHVQRNHKISVLGSQSLS